MSVLDSAAKIPAAFKIKTSHYIIASLSLVTALSWNEAMKQTIKSVYTVPNDLIWGNIVYAVMITFILIIVIYMLPDTKAELPADTQAKIRQEETTERIQNMQSQFAILKAQNQFLLAKVV